MKRALAGVVAIALAILVVVLVLRRDQVPARDEPAPGAGSAASMSRVAADARLPDAASRTDRVRRLSRADREALGAQIAAARAKARSAATAASGGAEPSLPDDKIPLERVTGPVRQAMEAAIPILAQCYEKRFGSAAVAGRTAAVQMQMTSDPELGTVIDTPVLTDERGQPLDRELDDCLRTTIEELALPPLGVGGVLPLQYSFRFD